MEIFGQSVARGEKKFFSVPVGSYANGAEAQLPVIVVRGNTEGPVFWISGEVHGEELNGSIAAWEFLRSLSPSDLKGTVIATPVANPLALSDRNKISFIDYLDMDTTFPGNPTGTWTQRIAGILFQEMAKHANYVLSFHTLAPRHFAKPYTVSKIVPDVPEEICRMSQKLAVAFGVEANCSVDLRTAAGELPGVTSGAMDILCMQKGIPAFMAEMGCASSIERSSIEEAKRGMINVLSLVGMLSASRKAVQKQLLITKRGFLRSPRGGMLEDRIVDPGDIVRKGEVYARVHFFGDMVEEYSAPCDFYVIAARKHPVIQTGERFVFVGTEWKEVSLDTLT